MQIDDVGAFLDVHRAAIQGSYSMRNGVLGVVFGDTVSDAKDFWIPLSDFELGWLDDENAVSDDLRLIASGLAHASARFLQRASEIELAASNK
jgi:hypothetical protein